MNRPAGTLPFPIEEYVERQAAVREVLTERGIDVLLVTSPANLFYLTGYEASWYPPRLPVSVAIRRDTTETVFYDWTRHRDHVEHTTLYDAAVYFEYGDSAITVADDLAERGLVGRVAIEWSSPSPVPGIMNDLARELVRGGATIVEGDWIVDTLRLYKSPAEVERVRSAAAMLDNAFDAMRTRLRAGMSELEISATMGLLLASEGSEIPAMNPVVSSGPTAWRDVHAFPSTRRVELGDLVSLDASAVVDRYHVNLSRVFSIGGGHETAEGWLRASATSLETLVAQAVPNADPAPAMTAAEQILHESVPPENIWWTGGYSLGIAFPPSWVGHTYLANDGTVPITLRPGYVSNFETVLYDRDRGFEIAPIDTVLMTEHGLEVLSRIPRELLAVDG